MRLSTFAAGVLSFGMLAGACTTSTDSGGSGSGGARASGGSTGSSGGSTGSSGGSTGSSGGSTGSSGGTTGSSGGTSGGSGGGSGSDAGSGPVTPAFMSVLPCDAETAYVTTGAEITFGTGGLVYTPKCLRVKKGTEVTFTGNFTVHPLSPSTKRGAQTDNPVTKTATGMSAKFMFAKSGFYAYWCDFHGDQDSGKFMAGVVWVTD